MNQKNEIDNIYKKAGYKTISISALEKSNLSDLLNLMQNKVCVFSGHSGVGKSTLLNSLDDNLSIKTTFLDSLYFCTSLLTSLLK